MVRPLSSSGWHAMSGLVMKTGFIVQQIEGLHHMAEKAKKEAAKIVRMGFIGYGIQGRTVLEGKQEGEAGEVQGRRGLP